MAVRKAAQKKKKTWFEIASPIEFGGKPVGETIADEASQLTGRTVMTNLGRISGDLKKQNVNVKLIIDSVKEGKAETSLIAMQLQPSSIRRMVRIGVTRIDESFICKTKDNVTVRVKPLLVTRGRIKSHTRKDIKKFLIDELKKAIAQNNFNQAIQSMINFSLQKGIKAKIDKIHPLKAFQIRYFGQISGKPVRVDNKEEPAAEVKEEAKAEEKPEVKEAAEEKPKKEKEEEAKEEAEEKPKKKGRKKKAENAEKESS